jgi:hypothetical protein
MLKPLILAAVLAFGSWTMAAAAPISSSPTMFSDTISVSRVKHLRDRAPVSTHPRNYAIALSMGLLVSLIAAAVVTD